jgi:hypothetical protein
MSNIAAGQRSWADSDPDEADDPYTPMRTRPRTPTRTTIRTGLRARYGEPLTVAGWRPGPLSSAATTSPTPTTRRGDGRRHVRKKKAKAARLPKIKSFCSPDEFAQAAADVSRLFASASTRLNSLKARRLL